jgi:hypothetical protein
LYDLLEDPNEWRNVADDPRYEKTGNDLMKQLKRRRKPTDDPYLDPERLERAAKRYAGR